MSQKSGPGNIKIWFLVQVTCSECFMINFNRNYTGYHLFDVCYISCIVENPLYCLTSLVLITTLPVWISLLKYRFFKISQMTGINTQLKQLFLIWLLFLCYGWRTRELEIFGSVLKVVRVVKRQSWNWNCLFSHKSALTIKLYSPLYVTPFNISTTLVQNELYFSD